LNNTIIRYHVKKAALVVFLAVVVPNAKRHQGQHQGSRSKQGMVQPCTHTNGKFASVPSLLEQGLDFITLA